MRFNKGFTLIEVVIAIVVIALLGSGGYLLWQKYYPSSSPLSYVTPTPILDKESRSDTIVAQYPDVEGESWSADGKWGVAIRTDNYSKEAVVLIDKTSNGRVVISQSLLSIVWGKLEPDNWSADDKFVYVYWYGSPLSRDLYVIRTDGQTFANGSSFLDVDDSGQLLQISGQFFPRVMGGHFAWAGTHTLQWTEYKLDDDGGFTSTALATWKLNVDAMTLTSEVPD